MQINKLPQMDDSFQDNQRLASPDYRANPSKPKMKRKKVTIIKKRHQRDGSVSVSKKHVYGMTVS